MRYFLRRLYEMSLLFGWIGVTWIYIILNSNPYYSWIAIGWLAITTLDSFVYIHVRKSDWIKTGNVIYINTLALLVIFIYTMIPVLAKFPLEASIPIMLMNIITIAFTAEKESKGYELK